MPITLHKLTITTGDISIDTVRASAGQPKGLVLIPPLIGGDVSQALKLFRRLVGRGFDLVSFTFSGHGRSTGRFCLETAPRNCASVIAHIRQIVEREKVPLFGIGCCYAAIPLLYGAHRHREPFAGMVLINAIPRIDVGAAWDAYWAYYRQTAQTHRQLPGLISTGRQFLDFLFPGIVRTRVTFGELHLSRTRPLKIVYQALAGDPLHHVQLHKTPVLCMHAREDTILNHIAARSAEHYQSIIRKTCTRVTFKELKGDHFLSKPEERREGMNAVMQFLETRAA